MRLSRVQPDRNAPKNAPCPGRLAVVRPRGRGNSHRRMLRRAADLLTLEGSLQLVNARGLNHPHR